ncbi:hypothetical protein ISS85_01155 [Candidatus Microgenomates bacterium]|nr:hypothetical protein [Candidatus Microgenomates bacterium]
MESADIETGVAQKPRSMRVDERLGNPTEGYNQRAFVFREVKYGERPEPASDLFVEVFREPEKLDSRSSGVSGVVHVTEFPKTVEADVAIVTTQRELEMRIDRTGKMRAKQKETRIDGGEQTTPVRLDSDGVVDKLATLATQREALIRSGFNAEDLDSLIGQMRGQVAVARAITLAERIAKGERVDADEVGKAFKDMDGVSLEIAWPAIKGFGELVSQAYQAGAKQNELGGAK